MIGLFGCAGALLVGAARQPEDPRSPTEPVAVAIPSPAESASSLPQMTVSPRGVLLSWVEQNGPRASLKFAERTPTGWTPPVRVASGDNWFLNWADVSTPVENLTVPPGENLTDRRGDEPYAVGTS